MENRISISVPEAAAATGLGKNLMYELIKRPDCDFAFQIGNRWLVSVSKLQAWIDRQTEKNRE